MDKRSDAITTMLIVPVVIVLVVVAIAGICLFVIDADVKSHRAKKCLSYSRSGEDIRQNDYCMEK